MELSETQLREIIYRAVMAAIDCKADLAQLSADLASVMHQEFIISPRPGSKVYELMSKL